MTAPKRPTDEEMAWAREWARSGAPDNWMSTIRRIQAVLAFVLEERRLLRARLDAVEAFRKHAHDPDISGEDYKSLFDALHGTGRALAAFDREAGE